MRTTDARVGSFVGLRLRETSWQDFVLILNKDRLRLSRNLRSFDGAELAERTNHVELSRGVTDRLVFFLGCVFLFYLRLHFLGTFEGACSGACSLFNHFFLLLRYSRDIANRCDVYEAANVA